MLITMKYVCNLWYLFIEYIAMICATVSSVDHFWVFDEHVKFPVIEMRKKSAKFNIKSKQMTYTNIHDKRDNTQCFDYNINEEAGYRLSMFISILFHGNIYIWQTIIIISHSVSIVTLCHIQFWCWSQKKKEKKNDMEMKESAKHHQWKVKMEKPANTCTFRAIQIAIA